MIECKVLAWAALNAAWIIAVLRAAKPRGNRRR